MNLMERAKRHLVDRLIQCDSVEAVYHSVGIEKPVRVIPRTTRRSVNDASNISLDGDNFDFIISAEDWPNDPISGDRIICRGKVYEVNAFAETNLIGAVTWRWCEGVYGTARRIHVKMIGYENE